MNNDDFKKIFIDITKNQWIKGVNNYTNSVGITFENLLGKKTDNKFFPDYYGIEIKTTTRFSRFPISLFSIAFDGPSFFETNRILQSYGKIDCKYNGKKILMGSLNTTTPTKLSDYSFQIETNSNDNKMYLKVYDTNNNLIEKKSFIYLSTILERIKIKLSNLVLVYASKKKINNDLYFRYYSYNKYKLKDNIDITNLINNGILKIVIMCRISRSGTEEGRQRNKALVFQLDKKNINKLYDIVDNYDWDDTNNSFKIINI